MAWELDNYFFSGQMKRHRSLPNEEDDINNFIFVQKRETDSTQEGAEKNPQTTIEVQDSDTWAEIKLMMKNS